MFIYELDLSIAASEEIPVVEVTQTDDLQYFHINMTDIDTDGLTARVYMTKPDTKKIFNDCEVGEKVIFKLTDQMSAAVGIVKAVLIFYDSHGLKIHSSIFKMKVKPKPEDDSAVESTDEFTALDNALHKAENVKDGKSAYEIAVDKGFDGTEEEWLESLKGKRDEVMLIGWTSISPNTYSELNLNQYDYDTFTILVYVRKGQNRRGIKFELTKSELLKFTNKAVTNELVIARSMVGINNENNIALIKQTMQRPSQQGDGIGTIKLKYQIYENNLTVTGLDNFEFCMYARE